MLMCNDQGIIELESSERTCSLGVEWDVLDSRRSRLLNACSSFICVCTSCGPSSVKLSRTKCQSVESEKQLHVRTAASVRKRARAQ